MKFSTSTEIETLRILIRKAENGYVVDVFHPQHMIPRPHNPAIQSFQKILSMGGGSEVSPEQVMKELQSTISGIDKKPEKPLRRPHEEYVFTSLDKAMDYIRESLEAK